MVEHRNIFLHGLSFTLRRFPALLWTYIFNLALAFLFSLSLSRQLSGLLSHSLAAQGLSNGFDLGIVGEIIFHLHEGPVGNAGAEIGHASIPLYLFIYFLLVPGTLFCYQTDTRARLGILLQQGLLHFWRFVRITLLTLLVAPLILGPLHFLLEKLLDSIDDHLVGRPAFLCIVSGYIIFFLIASVIRLYFDLVEVYTVQLGLYVGPLVAGNKFRSDRRVRRTLSPAWHTLFNNFARIWPVFLFLSLLGITVVILTARISMHMLAQPRVWPTFLLAQFGLFFMLFTRFWQRGVETSLAHQNPLANSFSSTLPLAGVVNSVGQIYSGASNQPSPSFSPSTPEPIADPEPAPPSLDEPDPGVFHHDPTKSRI